MQGAYRDPLRTAEILRGELVYSFESLSQKDLGDWGKRSAKLLPGALLRRISNIAALTVSAVGMAADGSVSATKALIRGYGRQYAAERADSFKNGAKSIAEGSRMTAQRIAKSLEENPKDGALAMVSALVGFYLGSGGDGDGGVPDLDLLGGIDAHRSIFTHSIIAGAVIEALVLSLQDLTSLVYDDLPEPHHKLWDVFNDSQSIAADHFVTGASLGIATHLGVDALIDGFTPYKDLPISLPAELHEALLGLNAVTEGAYGLRRASEADSSPRKPEAGYTSIALREAQMEESRTSHLDAVHQVFERKPISPHLQLDDERIDHLSKAGKEALEQLGLNFDLLENSADACRRKLQDAREPFRLGVIGEFRSGKSTLINALLGRGAAFVDILEATPVECVFSSGNPERAVVKFCDGTESQFSIEDVNSELSARRDDKAWVESVARVEYQLASNRLEHFDLWDAPGMGGSETNQLVAERFLDRLGSAIWVFDATLLGKATIAEPLHRLIRDGKPVHAVINRIDEYSDSLEEAEELLNRLFPATFASVTALSALHAFEKAQLAQVDERLELLWKRVMESVGIDAEEGRAGRIARAANLVKIDLGTTFTMLRLHAQDKIGLIQHADSNLKAAMQKTLKHLQSTVEEETENTFLVIESNLSEKIRNIEAESGPSLDEIGSRVVDYFASTKTQSEISERILGRVYGQLASYWSRYSDQAIDLSLASVPAILQPNVSIPVVAQDSDPNLGSTAPKYEPPAFLAAIRNKLFRSGLTDDAIDEGVYAAGLTAVVAAAVAATSAVTWPIILAALPIGSLTAWKKDLDARKVRKTPYEAFKDSMAAVKIRFAEESIPQLRTDVASHLTEVVQKQLEKLCQAQFGDSRYERAEQAYQSLKEIENFLIGHAEDIQQFSGKEVLAILRNPGDRLDLIVPGLRHNFSQILQVLPPATSVRVLVTFSGPLTDVVRQGAVDAFGQWQGNYKIVCAQSVREEAISNLQPLVLTADLALVPEKLNFELLTPDTVLSKYPKGRLAAQKYFAELWSGNCPEHGAIQVTHLF